MDALRSSEAFGLALVLICVFGPAIVAALLAVLNLWNTLVDIDETHGN